MASPKTSQQQLMVDAARFDPQVRIPVQPRVRAGLQIESDGDALVIAGTAKVNRFGGRSATALLPKLLELCDGSRTHGDLAAELGLREESVFSTLTTLWTSGIIEDAPATTAPEMAEQTATFISRLGDTTAKNTAWEDGARALSATRIVVWHNGADDGTAANLQALLTTDGMTVTAASSPSGMRPDADLVILTGTPDPDVSRTLFARGIAHLRFAVIGRTAHIGPYVDPRFTACLECRTADDEDDQRAPRPGDREFAFGLLTRDVFSLLSSSTPSPLPVHWRQIDLGRSRQLRRSAPTRPGCPTCSVTDGPVREPSTAARYEAAVAFPPRQFVGVKAHQAHYKPSNIALQQVHKTWPVAARVDLPEVRIEQIDQHTGVDVGAVAAILKFAAGQQGMEGSKVQRWTATGGNLGSVVAHLVARDVPGLEPGTYGYLPGDHALARLSARTDAVRSGAPATVILTGHFTKVARKYSAFALRICFLDAGCALTTARRVAAARGISFTQQHTWDDQHVAEALGTDLTEPVTTVFDLGGQR